MTQSRLARSLPCTGLALIIGATLMNEVRAESSTTPEQLIAAYTTLPKGKSQNYYLSMHINKTGKNSWFIVDTGSTGVRGPANFFGLTANERQGTCVHKTYSSSGNNYAGYVVNRNITLRSTLKSQTNVVSVDNLAVFAVMQSCQKGVTAQCGGAAPKGCTNTPKVFMMGVGLGRYAKTSPPPINPGNPLLNTQKMASGQLPRSYLAVASKTTPGLVFTLGATTSDFPSYSTSHTFKISQTGQKTGALVGALGQFVIVDGETDKPLYPLKDRITARLMPDTGLKYGILSVPQSTPPCCNAKPVSCGGSTKGLPTGTKVAFYATPNSTAPLTTIQYPSPTSTAQQCLRWSLNNSSNSALFNSGRAFFDKCALLYQPGKNTIDIGCNP